MENMARCPAHDDWVNNQVARNLGVSVSYRVGEQPSLLNALPQHPAL
jgi:hypothetical protein